MNDPFAPSIGLFFAEFCDTEPIILSRRIAKRSKIVGQAYESRTLRRYSITYYSAPFRLNLWCKPKEWLYRQYTILKSHYGCRIYRHLHVVLLKQRRVKRVNINAVKCSIRSLLCYNISCQRLLWRGEFQPISELSTADSGKVQFCWKRVPDGWSCDTGTPLAKLSPATTDKHVVSFSRTQMSPTRKVYNA